MRVHSVCELGAYLDAGSGVDLVTWQDLEEKILVDEMLERFEKEWPPRWLDIQSSIPPGIDFILDLSEPREKLVEDPADIYYLTRFDLLMVGIGEKTTDKLLKSIGISKSQPFWRTLFGLGIKDVGRTTARQLADKYKSLDILGRAPISELLNNEGIGSTVVLSVVKWFHHERNWKTVEKLRLGGLDYAFGYERPVAQEQTKEDQLEGTGSQAKGKEFMFTGRLSITRAKAQLMVSEAGGYNGTHVRKDTDYVVVGEDPGEKQMKAVALGIPMITEEEFFKMVQEVH
jgi:DNA ligase (NAD+)